MQHGKLAGNEQLNQRIHELLSELDPKDVSSFVRKFRSDTDAQNFHTFRELILGARLRGRGFNARYEFPIAGRTPDWSILATDGAPSEVVDVVTLHQRRSKDEEIGAAISRTGLWSRWMTIPPDHIFSKLEAKANVYADLAETANLPYVVGAFSEFTASIDPNEVAHVLYERHGGIFPQSPWLSGVIFFRDRHGDYEFTCFRNHTARRPSALLGDA